MFLSKYNKLSAYIKRHYRSLVPFLTIHKTFNVLLALTEMKTRRTFCASKPFVFRIEPCSLCNLRCVYCDSYNSEINEKRLMDLDDFKKIIDKIEKSALRASLYDMGEPLLNKSIYVMTKYADDHGISTLISTNFNLFSEKDVNALMDSRLTVLEPCLDGFSQENYVKYRRGGDVRIVKDGIRTIMENRRRERLKWPIVDVQVILFDHIKQEIPLIEKFLKECRVDKITYRTDRGSTNPKIQHMTGNKTCFWLYVGMSVRPDGNIYPCCGKGFNRFSYGNLLEQDLSEIWNNKYYRFSRSLFLKGNDLEYDEEMSQIPCITCNEFKKQRTMRASQEKIKEIVTK